MKKYFLILIPVVFLVPLISWAGSGCAACAANPSCSLTASPAVIYAGSGVTLSWNVTPTQMGGGTRFCYPGSLSAYGGIGPAPSGAVVVYPTYSTSYTASYPARIYLYGGASCIGTIYSYYSGAFSCSASITVLDPNCHWAGGTVANGGGTYAYAAPSVPYGSSCAYQYRTCSNGSLSGSYGYPSCSVNPPASCSWAGGAVAHGASAYAYAYPSVAYGQSCASYAQWRTCSNGSLSGSYGYSACSVNPPANCSWAGGTVAHGGSATAYQASTVPYGSSCVSQTRSCSNGSLSGSYGYPSCSVTPGANCTFNGSPVAHGTSVTAYAASTVPYGSTCAPQSQTRTCTNGTLSGTYTYSSCSVTPPASCTFAGTPVAHGASVTAYQTSTVPAGSSCTDVTQTRSCTNGTLSGTYTQASCNDNCTFNGDTVAHGDSVTAYQSSWVTSGSSCSAPETRTCTDGTLSGTNAFSSCMVGNPAACNFSGYAWSDNTGWLDMDGIVADTDGTMFGYGWSDILGWVSANPSDLIDCPIAPCIAEMDGSNINGWLRALSGSHSQSGDWGGWIRLHDTTYGVSLTEGGTLSGYGWGDDVVGWMDFEYAQTSCQPCQEKWECSGETIVHTSPQCTVTNVDTCELPSFCSAGSSICLLPPITFIQSGDKTGHLQLKPQLVVRGRSTKVYWNVDNVESCTVTGGNNSWTGKKSDPSGQVSNPINQQTVFTLSCTGLDGSNIRETATVGVVPVFQEI